MFKPGSKPNLVQAAITDYMLQGWNKRQATSLAWAEFFEEKAAQIEVKYQGNVDSDIRIDCHCKTCNDSGLLLPGTVIMWLGLHKGHDTKTVRLK